MVEGVRGDLRARLSVGSVARADIGLRRLGFFSLAPIWIMY